MPYDLIIIGSGIAGITAALQGVQQGLKVCVISEGCGATQLFSGAFDYWDDPHYSALKCQGDQPLLQEVVNSIPFDHPHHLYSRLFKLSESSSPLFDLLQQAARVFFEGIKMPVAGNGTNYSYAVSPSGYLKPTAFVAPSHHLDLRQDNQRDIHVIGFKGLLNYSNEQVAYGFDQLRCLGFQFNMRSSSINLDLSGGADTTVLDIAQYLETENGFNDFVSQLEKMNVSESVVLIPPVLGLSHAERIHKILEEKFRKKFIEVLSVIPSVSGLRLKKRIEEFLTAGQVDWVKGKVVGYAAANDRVQSLRVISKGETRALKAKNFILATGKYIGGGLTKDRLWEETIFGLPCTILEEDISKKSLSVLTGLHIHDEQPWMQCGLLCDNYLRPLNKHKQVEYKNLFAAGHILADFDYGHQRCGFGISALSGYLTVRHIIDFQS